jgi:hypothetical protein
MCLRRWRTNTFWRKNHNSTFPWEDGVILVLRWAAPCLWADCQWYVWHSYVRCGQHNTLDSTNTFSSYMFCNASQIKTFELGFGYIFTSGRPLLLGWVMGWHLGLSPVWRHQSLLHLRRIRTLDCGPRGAVRTMHCGHARGLDRSLRPEVAFALRCVYSDSVASVALLVIDCY